MNKEDKNLKELGKKGLIGELADVVMDEREIIPTKNWEKIFRETQEAKILNDYGPLFLKSTEDFIRQEIQSAEKRGYKAGIFKDNRPMSQIENQIKEEFKSKIIKWIEYSEYDGDDINAVLSHIQKL